MQQPARSLQTKQAPADDRGSTTARGVFHDVLTIVQRAENEDAVFVTAPVAGQSLQGRDKGCAPGGDHELVVCFNDSVGSSNPLRLAIDLDHLRTGVESYVVFLVPTERVDEDVSCVVCA